MPAVEGSSPVGNAIDAIAAGGFAVLADDGPDRRHATLVAAAETATEQALALLVRHSTGIVCVALPAQRLRGLSLTPSTREDLARARLAVPVDARSGTTTGASAHDRATTTRALADAASGGDDFVGPGHVFPLRARDGGVLARPGRPEAALDLARLAGRAPAGVLAEIVTDDGGLVGGSQVRDFARHHRLPVVAISDVVRHRRITEQLVEHLGEVLVDTPAGAFRGHVYRSTLDGREHLALVRGDVAGDDPVLTRVHSECLTGDVLGSLRCDCGQQLRLASERVAAEGRGVIVYVRGHEGRGIGLSHKLEAYALQDRGRDTVEANVELGLPIDARDYHVPAQILRHLGVHRIRLLTNNPDKIHQLNEYGIEVAQRVPLVVAPHAENAAYLEAKRAKLQHLLGADAA